MSAMLVKKLETFVPDDFLIRAGNGRKQPFRRTGLSHGGLCPHPPRNLGFLGFSFCCRLFGRKDISPRDAGASRYHNGAAPSVCTSPAPETHTSGQAATTAAQTASPKRGSNWVQAQPAVPAVSMARRRVDRLRAANIAAAPWKFARKSARPPSCVRVTWIQSESFRPYCFPVRAGGGYGRRFWAIRGAPARFGRALG